MAGQFSDSCFPLETKKKILKKRENVVLGVPENLEGKEK